MKQLFIIIFMLSSIVCSAQNYFKVGDSTGKTMFAVGLPNYCTCIAITFSAPEVKKLDTVAFVKSLLPEWKFDYASKIDWRFNGCDKFVEVRLFNKDYTFKQFRKLIYER